MGACLSIFCGIVRDWGYLVVVVHFCSGCVFSVLLCVVSAIDYDSFLWRVFGVAARVRRKDLVAYCSADGALTWYKFPRQAWRRGV